MAALLGSLLAQGGSHIRPLGAVQPGHPCLWGQLGVEAPPPLLIEQDARLLPTRRTGQADTWWTSRKQGAVDGQGQPIEALTDLRGERPIYALPRQAPSGQGGKHRPLALYGGTIFEHFGHLLLDLNRLYRLLPLFRRSREPIWFHYPALGESGEIEHPLVTSWLDCLGIRKRARVVRRTLICEQLVSSPVLYRDRCYVTADFPRAARRALAPKLRRQLRGLRPEGAPIAYLSRHKLNSGTTCFAGEEEVVAALSRLGNVDVICPEDLSIEAKLGLYRRYRLVTGFVQAAMLLKYFLPSRQPGDLAEQCLLVAGHHSLNSNWVNLERAYGFGDHLLDCSDPLAVASEPGAEGSDFQRQAHFNVGLVIDQLRALAER
jgi:hypothetical protein